jgi:hypothetical protein
MDDLVKVPNAARLLRYGADERRASVQRCDGLVRTATAVDRPTRYHD